jgi:hypothetical protein
MPPHSFSFMYSKHFTQNVELALLQFDAGLLKVDSLVIAICHMHKRIIIYEIIPPVPESIELSHNLTIQMNIHVVTDAC